MHNFLLTWRAWQDLCVNTSAQVDLLNKRHGGLQAARLGSAARQTQCFSMPALHVTFLAGSVTSGTVFVTRQHHSFQAKTVKGSSKLLTHIQSYCKRKGFGQAGAARLSSFYTSHLPHLNGGRERFGKVIFHQKLVSQG